VPLTPRPISNFQKNKNKKKHFFQRDYRVLAHDVIRTVLKQFNFWQGCDICYLMFANFGSLQEADADSDEPMKPGATLATDDTNVTEPLDLRTLSSGGDGAQGKQNSRGTKRPRDTISSDDNQAAAEDMLVEVTSGEGVTQKFTLPPLATILTVKQAIEHATGVIPRDAHLFVHGGARETELQDDEAVSSLRVGKGTKVGMSLLVVQADAQHIIPGLAAEAQVVLGAATGVAGDEKLTNPLAVSFMPAHPHWVVLTEYGGDRVKINHVRTGALVCKFGESGNGDGQFYGPRGVTVTPDSSLLLVVDCQNHRVQVLRLMAHANGSSASLEFVRQIGNGGGSDDGQLLCPMGMALLGEGANTTVLVAEQANHRVSQFKLDGTFIRIFAGTGKEGSGDGEFAYPRGITVLGSSGEVAVVDYDNYRIQIFNAEGAYSRQFGSEGKENDGEFDCPTGLTSDAHGNLLVTDLTNRLQVFSPKGLHLCTRNDLGLNPRDAKGLAWNAAGGLAVANGAMNNALLWGTPPALS
jgi:DNA-binding beta-propeller fold protein YncE